MRVLLDENVPKRLIRHLPRGVEGTTVPLHGWAGRKNGELLSTAAREFDVFLTVDKSIPYQQDLSRLDLAVVVLEAETNSLEDLVPLMTRVSNVLTTARSGEAIHVGA